MARPSVAVKQQIIKDIKAKKMGIKKIAEKHNVPETLVKNIKKQLECLKCQAEKHKPAPKKIEVKKAPSKSDIVFVEKANREFPLLTEADMRRIERDFGMDDERPTLVPIIVMSLVVVAIAAIVLLISVLAK